MVASRVRVLVVYDVVEDVHRVGVIRVTGVVVFVDIVVHVCVGYIDRFLVYDASYVAVYVTGCDVPAVCGYVVVDIVG